MTDKPCTPNDVLVGQIAALDAKVNALGVLLNEREERTKERFIAMEKAVNTAMSAADKAVSKAEMATEKRFEGVNEFRATLADQAATLLPRNEYSVQHGAMLERVESFQKQLGALTSTVSLLQEHATGKREGLTYSGQIVLGAIAFVSAVAASFAAASHFIK